MSVPVGAFIVVGISGALWGSLVALEWLVARWRRRHRLSDGLLRSYHRESMRESAPQHVSWPKQRKGSQPLWDRRPAKLRDVSRRAS